MSQLRSVALEEIERDQAEVEDVSIPDSQGYEFGCCSSFESSTVPIAFDDQVGSSPSMYVRSDGCQEVHGTVRVTSYV